MRCHNQVERVLQLGGAFVDQTKCVVTPAGHGLDDREDRKVEPEAERERILGFAIPMIQFTLSELRDLLRQQQGLPELDYSQENSDANRWIQSAVLAFANLPDYPAPVMLTLDSFEQVQASVFQVARSPGMYIVYLGCLFLIIGVFSMFYIRDRRVWVWIRPHNQGSSVMAAMTSQRRNMDFNLEFDRLKAAFNRLSV